MVKIAVQLFKDNNNKLKNDELNSNFVSDDMHQINWQHSKNDFKKAMKI